jgi:hypothetical protein
VIAILTCLIAGCSQTGNLRYRVGPNYKDIGQDQYKRQEKLDKVVSQCISELGFDKTPDFYRYREDVEKLNFCVYHSGK